MNWNGELPFGTVFCVRRAAIVPNRSSALHSHGSWSQCIRRTKGACVSAMPAPTTGAEISPC
jgi:hypothetical protein